MGLVRGTAILVKADLPKLTGRLHLTNLEVPTGFDLDDVLVEASDWIFDLIESSLGTAAPGNLENAAGYKRAAAHYALALLTQGKNFNALDEEDAQALFDRAMSFFEQIKPQLTEGNEPRTAGEGALAIGNLDRRSLLRGGRRDEHWGDRSRRRDAT